ncbi:MAG: hypothetical protein KAV42_01030 [Candidatus Krumholzibacteria bacterium]|nr:hypothetical protein [Candidatus Krumholzibacteria bacterium]
MNRNSLVLLFVFLVLFSGSAMGEDWKLSMDANVTFTENTYSDNWVGGEAGALIWVFNSNFLAEKQLTSSLHSRNTLKLLFGQTHNQNVETKVWRSPEKSTDLIDFESVLKITKGWIVDPFLSGRIETQFWDASDPENERYINPMKITEALGVSKDLIKEEKREWSVRLGVATRQYVDRDQFVDKMVDDTKETMTSYDGGMQFDSEFKTTFSEDKITLTSKLTVYQALVYSEKDAVAGTVAEDYWKAPDVNWENIFTANITKYLMVNLYIQLLYDKEVDLGGRFKQTMALGVTYKFI